MLGAAALTGRRLLAAVAAGAALLFGAPHLLCHLRHLDAYEGMDAVGNAVSLTLAWRPPSCSPSPCVIRGRWRRRREGMALALATYAESTSRLDLAGIDFAAFRDRPLDADSLRCLRYMHDVESHTVCYLRDLLATRAHRDPDITTFLTCWSFEEHWHGDAIARVLSAHDEPHGAVRVARTRERRDGWRPALFAAVSAALPSLPAVHMTWGAVNEWTTQAGYALLARRSGHPVLAELLRRIMRQEGRHIDVYSAEARWRLAASSTARRLTRLALRRFWSPVGAGVMPDGEVRFLVRHLFAGDEGAAMASRIDRRVDALPGLSGLGLVSGAVRAAA